LRQVDGIVDDPAFHGHDWTASLAKWRPIALEASTREDFDEMVNWMLGEMNSSHMGFTGGGPGPTDPAETDVTRTGELGVLWDEAFAGPGRRVREVLPESPAARAISRLRPGDVVLAVDGRAVADERNWDRLLAGTVEQETLLRVQGADGAERELTIRPSASLARPLYERAIRAARARTEEAGGGRLGYVHVEAMGTGSLLDFERALAEAGAGKDCLLIDVRENGGGWTTDMMLTMLMGRDHAITVPRGGGEGYPQDRLIFARWDKPVVVLCNENSYSNAEIFSWAIRTLQRGPLVGKRTYGAVISTGGAGLLDGSFVRIPFRGWYVNDGTRTNMELNGCPPDHGVEILPQDYAAGLDRQLEKAIGVGLELLD
jgi:tricorn protease